MLFSIQNLKAAQVTACEPWNMDIPIPEEAASDKDEFIKWCSRPSTRYCHYSGVEGVNGFMRVLGKDNPPCKIHALVVDYDAPFTDKRREELLSNAPSEFLPTWCSKTFSGRARLVWEFESPVLVPNTESAISFLKLIGDKIKLRGFLPGLDDKYQDPSQYYALGSDWEKLSDSKVPESFLRLWMMEAGKMVNWEKYHELAAIPIEAIITELEQRYPGRWDGDFHLGAVGKRFWDPAADNPRGCVVRESGMQCFTGPKGFVSWREIFGSSFVEGYEADRTGKALQNIFFDGMKFWLRTGDREFNDYNKENLRLILADKYGLETRKARGQRVSDVDKVIVETMVTNRVEAALPFVHFKEDEINMDGEKFLNTARARCCPPAPEAGEWGERFPWLAKFYDNFFSLDDAETQRLVFLAWLKRFYTDGLRGRPNPGQVLLIAGPPASGKTTLATEILGRMVGGSAEVKELVDNKSTFFGARLRKPIITINDSAANSSTERHKLYSSSLKMLAANKCIGYNEKFKQAGQVWWNGRVIVTMNDDPESIQMIPDLEQSNLDKLIMFRTSKTSMRFPNDDADEFHDMLNRETPEFGAWLLNWEVPETIKGNPRFGVYSYHHPFLLETGLEQGPSESFLELLNLFLNTWSQQPNNRGKLAWEGNAHELYHEMCTDPMPTASLVSKGSTYEPRRIGKRLGALDARGFNVKSSKKTRNGRVWTIPVNLRSTLMEETKKEKEEEKKEDE